ncbi:uncharacterized protein BCR38DRAFT_338969 [Pseudomassariella vexata]|uniref:Extracellular membrane protein CFEM domain-containing protein n=1 Tax=Pseudomassariella vexata TaxID=1141098 RepID=A0A1Y2E460_9PEZI|nr:uncharacterized protein BCR38DRAFT_338969 [Pseudomassariella vexata]ORY66340.1 hypothetical protein BCR38DRAFT_338969 [Pseudomassariella vexata]
MRFTSIIVAGIFALSATAQSTTGETSVSSTTTSAVPTNSVQAAIDNCLKACESGDVNCQAKCITVPSPDNAAANATTECVANCDQGSGSAADNTAYGSCVDGCIAQYFYSTTGGASAATATAAGTGTGTGSASVTAIVSTITDASTTFETTVGSSTIEAGSATESGTGSSATSTSSSAAGMLFSPAAPVGLLGFLVAMLAL